VKELAPGGSVANPKKMRTVVESELNFSATSAISGLTTIEPPFQVALNKSELGKLKDPEAAPDDLQIVASNRWDP